MTVRVVRGCRTATWLHARGGLGSGEPRESCGSLLERHLHASVALASSAHENARCRRRRLSHCEMPSTRGDAAGARTVVDEMWAAFRDFHHGCGRPSRGLDELAQQPPTP